MSRVYEIRKYKPMEVRFLEPGERTVLRPGICNCPEGTESSPFFKGQGKKIIGLEKWGIVALSFHCTGCLKEFSFDADEISAYYREANRYVQLVQVKQIDLDEMDPVEKLVEDRGFMRTRPATDAETLKYYGYENAKKVGT